MSFIEGLYKNKLLSDDIYFKLTFIFIMIFHNLTIGQYFTGYFSIILIIWGALLVFRNIVLKKIMFPKMYLYISILFLLSYIITIFLNRDLNILSNIKSLIWMTIILLVLFPKNIKDDYKKVTKELKFLSKIIIVPTFIISLISLLLFFFNIFYWQITASNLRIPQGYYAARLWGIYVDPNQACNVAMISIVFSIIYIYLSKQRKVGSIVFNIINILIQYIFIIMSASRGGGLGLIFLVIGLIYILSDKILIGLIDYKYIRLAVSLIVAISFSVVLAFSINGTKKLVAFIPEFIYRLEHEVVIENNNEEQSQLENDNGINLEENILDINTVRPDGKGSNGRIQLWLDGFKLSQKSLIFGHGDRNINDRAKVYIPDSELIYKHSHNGYIHLLLSGGIIAFILMFILIGKIAFESFTKIVITNSYDENNIIMSILSVLAGTLLVTTVFLSELFYFNSFTTLIFWCILGYIVFFNKRYDE